MNSIIFPTICLNNSKKLAELWIQCTVWRRGSCEARGYSLALMMSRDGGWAEAEVVSFTVIFSRIKTRCWSCVVERWTWRKYEWWESCKRWRTYSVRSVFFIMEHRCWIKQRNEQSVQSQKTDKSQYMIHNTRQRQNRASQGAVLSHPHYL